MKRGEKAAGRRGGRGGDAQTSGGSEDEAGGKERVVWTDKMKESFRQAVDTLGPSASPKLILQEMKEYPELGRQHISSHLQKHRMYNKRLEDLKVQPGGQVAKGKRESSGRGQRRGTAAAVANGAGGSLKKGAKPSADGAPARNGTARDASGSKLAPSVAVAGVGTLAQIVDMTRILSDAQFVECNAITGPNSTIGKHFRHVIVHYKALIAATKPGKRGAEASCFYDDPQHRGRGGACETDRNVCLSELSGIQKWFKNVKARDLAAPVEARFTVSAEGVDDGFSSTLGREIMFLNHHAVHHLASVATICRDMGVELPKGFGMAPSTLASGIGVDSSA